MNNKEMVIEEKENQQIEEWTGLQMGNIIFDSDVDDWNVGTSVFDQKVMNKSNLLFLIEDVDGSLFGGYVNTIIDKYQSWIHDPKSFLFSLKSNGRLNGMRKFDSIDDYYGFFLYDRSYGNLFLFGGGYDILIGKANNKSRCICSQESYDYKGVQNVLCGKSYLERFTTKRVVVIQLI